MKGLVLAMMVISLVGLCTPAYAQGDLKWLPFSVLGVEQAGASSTKADQRFFFDLSVTRPLPFGGSRPAPEDYKQADDITKANYDSSLALQKWVHWWGDVRAASYPQQINAPVGEFVTGLGTKVADVKVNEFVQAAEFRTGFDVRIPGSSGLSRFSTFADFGGVGSMDPKQSVSIFKIPKESIARTQFFNRYPSAQYPGLENADYVAFSSPDRSRFFRQYAAGLRYTQLREEKTADGKTDFLVPATVSASFGQHELVTGGKSVGVVGIFEGFFPFKLGGVNAYVFGRALMSLRKNSDTQPIFLDPAIAENKPVQPTAPGVFVISAPSDRDVYTVGIGIDPLQVIRGLVRPK